MKMTHEALQAILKRPGYSIEGQPPKANPDLGAVESPKYSKPQRALERNVQAKQSRKGSLACSVEIVALRKRLLDSDNLSAGAKPLRDAIAASLYIDDGSERIRFHYGQSLTDGPEGTIVRIAWPRYERTNAQEKANGA